MTNNDQVLSEIAMLELAPSTLPSQDEVKEFAQRFSTMAGKVDEFHQFSREYNDSGSLKKWWDSDVARDKMLLGLSVTGELSVLANKLLALNVVFAQRISAQTSSISDQSTDIHRNQEELKVHSQKLVEIQKDLLNGLERMKAKTELLASKRRSDSLKATLAFFMSFIAILIAIASSLQKIGVF